MRIGFAAVYSWRPHVEHLYFLARLAKQAGHKVFFLTCDGDLDSCYTRELRDKPAWRECLQCRAGGLRSYSSDNVLAIRELRSKEFALSHEQLRSWAGSSASTLGRFETAAEYQSDEFLGTIGRLEQGVADTYSAARQWIRQERLDAVCAFNGRMDATRAILEAAAAEKIRYLSVERTWFGDGLQLLPDESCLGLRNVHSMIRGWCDRPLTRDQALRAGSHVAGRILRTNFKEWRSYNLNGRSVSWPGGDSARRKVLLIPSSLNEVWGHQDWEMRWPEPTAAYDAIIEHLALLPGEVVLRCHPNWGENIGKNTGERSERYYSEWAARRGIQCIQSKEPASTMDLIDQCDAIVVASGSAALEAGVLGKQVISIGPANYQEAGFRDSAYDMQELRMLRLHTDLSRDEQALLARRNARLALRFCYTAVYRLPQYVAEVQSITTTKYRYNFGADPQRFIDILRSGRLVPDDSVWAPDAREEDAVLALVEHRDWIAFKSDVVPESQELKRLRRRFMYRSVDWIGARKSIGDR
jgi:hypothetical protein